MLVNKKDSSKRLVIDLRQLNSVVAPELIKLPKINELLDEVSLMKCKYLSTADLRSGFYQIALAENSRPLTTFTAPSGLRFQYTVCPFGLSTSPSAMLHVLLTFFSGIIRNSGIFIYCDDLLVVGHNWETHWRNLEDMLQTLQKNSLTAKCELGFYKLEYLGIEIGQEGVEISRRKLAVIEKIPPPTTKNISSKY